MPLRRVTATRYVTALREGGSLPGLLEADDDGIYVTKFSGAGQGEGALVAEVLAGELGRALGLAVPELVVIDVPPELGHAEPDPEIQELLAASPGPNLGMDFLPGSLPFTTPAEPPIDPALAADIVWFDALVTNVDRTHRNPNLLLWHGGSGSSTTARRSSAGTASGRSRRPRPRPCRCSPSTSCCPWPARSPTPTVVSPSAPLPRSTAPWRSCRRSGWARTRPRVAPI